MKTLPSSKPLPLAAFASLLALSVLAVPDGQAADSPKKKPDSPAAADSARPKKPEASKKGRAESPGERELKKELDQVRDSLHEAQKELAAKAEEIASLESKLAKATADLKKAEAAGADLAKRDRERDADLREKVVAMQNQLKVVQKEAAEAIAKAKAKADASPKVSVVVSSGGAVVATASASSDAKPKEPAKPQATAPAKPQAAAPAKPAAAPAKVPVIDPVPYDRLSAVNYQERDRALAQVRAALKQHPDAKISITGHADDSRYAEANQEISENRANFLASHFSVNGIPRDRIEAKGLGNSRPVKGEDGNRRVEIQIKP